MQQKKIIIVWEGFPVCGLRTLELEKFYSEIVLFGTKPNVPFENLTSRIIDIEQPGGLERFSKELETADLVIATGWTHKDWLQIIRVAKKVNKTLKVCLAVDNNLKMSVRQRIGKHYFRFFIEPLADFYFAAGKSTHNLLTYFDVSPAKIFLGYYGSNSDIFYQRNILKRTGFVYVGQKIKRKGIDILVDAYDIYKDQLNGNQPLYLIGGESLGDLSLLNKYGKSEIGFLQPEDCSKVFALARTLILPSYEEHWGTVVCEAAACGCSLLLSNKVGSAPDLLMEGVNGFQFSSGSSNELASLMIGMDELPDVWHQNSVKVSVNRASNFDEKAYLSSVIAMLGA